MCRAMRMAPAFFLWLVLLSPVTVSSSSSLHAQEPQWPIYQQRSTAERRSSHASTRSAGHQTGRSAALIEGSDETIEPYSKNQPGRHVCTQEQAVTEPVKTRESYCRPVYKTYTLPCEDGKTCRRYRVVYETAYRDVVKMRVTRKTSYTCCPGWTQSSKVNHGCTKAVCTQQCQNGGACLKPDFCGCRPGFMGKHCEQDLDECAAQQHSCEHTCVNTDGSYYCRCRQGFTLQGDGRSCQALLPTTTQVPEVTSRRDREELEDEDEDERDFTVEYINLTRRISKLEKLMHKPLHSVQDPNISLNEINTKLQIVLDNVAVLKGRVDRMEKRITNHHHKSSGKRSHYIAEDPRIEALNKQITVLKGRMDECACTSESANKINL